MPVPSQPNEEAVDLGGEGKSEGSFDGQFIASL